MEWGSLMLTVSDAAAQGAPPHADMGGRRGGSRAPRAGLVDRRHGGLRNSGCPASTPVILASACWLALAGGRRFPHRAHTPTGTYWRGTSIRMSSVCCSAWMRTSSGPNALTASPVSRSEEHTSELQSRRDLVCRLLLE